MNNSTLNSKAYLHLRDMIARDLLEDGVIYSETIIARQIGVSRTPIRDALQRLEMEGFIEILPSRGFQLLRITPELIEENCQVRSALEGYCALTLANTRNKESSRQALLRIGELLEEQRRIYETGGELLDFVNSDFLFHSAIVDSIGNKELSRIFFSHFYCIQKLSRKSLMYAGRLEATLREHTAMYDAIRNGDTANVYSTTMEHMKNSAVINLAEAVRR